MNLHVDLKPGHSKLDDMVFLKGIGLQVYQYKEHLVLNQRLYTRLSTSIRKTMSGL